MTDARVNFYKFRKKGIMERHNKYANGYICTICKKNSRHVHIF